MTEKISLYSSTHDQFCAQIFERLGRGKDHASIVYSDLFRHGHLVRQVEPQAECLVSQILSLTDYYLPPMGTHRADEKIEKFLLTFEDGLQSESVILPMKSGRTLCISSQVGCKMGCAFCETGRMGLLRNLSAKEIVMQVAFAKSALKVQVRNLVFMGMGEPFDNFEELKKAVKILCDPKGLGLGPSRITISTSGDVDAIYRFMNEFDPAVNLAVSINAPNDEIRSKIMPINQKWNMDALKKCLIDYCKNPRRMIFAEYVLLKDINDSLSCAEELAKYLSGLNVKVNLIPYNSQSHRRFSPPNDERIELFSQVLRKEGYDTLLRKNKGRGIMAACGQLGNKQQRLKMRQNGKLPIL